MNEKDHAELLRLINLWEGSGRDWSNEDYLRQAGQSRDALQARIQRVIHISPLLLEGPAAKLLNPGISASREDRPAYLLGQMMLDQECGDFWGGRCRRCSRFYVRKTRHQKVYCSKACRAKRSGKEYKAASRSSLKEAILEIVNRKCADYAGLPLRRRQRIDWKTWVADQTSAELIRRKEAPRDPITPKWISRNKIEAPAI
jgi:hypothetical protein